MVNSSTGPIRLVVSDVDGTLVRHDKTLAVETIAAVTALRRHGIRFGLVSSRPPTGLDVLVEPLGVDTPRAGFNGGLILDPQNRVVAELTIPEAACRAAVAHLQANGVDTWVFADGRWYATSDEGHYVPREKQSIHQNPHLVPDFAPHLGRVHKVMGASPDFALMGRMEAEVRATLGPDASVHRSQSYYLDITHPDANKGFAAASLARLLGIDVAEMCCLGDMPNDVPMFEVAGLSVCMGNAPEAVQKLATEVTGSNDDTGWSDAIERFVLPRAP